MSAGVARIFCGSLLLAGALAIVGGAQAVSSSAGATEPILQLSVSSVVFGNLTLGDGEIGTFTVTNTSFSQDDMIPTPTITVT